MPDPPPHPPQHEHQHEHQHRRRGRPPGARAADGHRIGELTRWRQELEDYRHNRLARVQASAQTWLATLGTILGLAGTVLAVKGPSTLGETTSSPVWRLVLLVVAALVFLLALLAVFFAASATWGGLRATRGPDQRVSGRRGAGPAGGTDTRGADDVPPLLRGVLAWLGQEEGPPGRRAARPQEWTAADYREYVELQATSRRRYLHRSRMVGLMAGAGAGILVLAALGLGTFGPRPAPAAPTVIAVHGGRISCGPLGHDAAGNVLVAGQRLTGVTQVLVTDHC